MSINYNARVVSTGLVLNLDASNPLSLSNGRTNLFSNPETFDNAAWAKNSTSLAPNQTAAPDGSLTADMILESTDAGVNFHSLGQTLSLLAGTYTVSAYVKPAGTDITYNGFEIAGFGGSNFNLNTGTKNFDFGGAVGGIINVGNGWFRVYSTATIVATSYQMFMQLSTASGNTNYQGTGKARVYVWGAQLELGSTPTTYYPISNTTTPQWKDLSGYEYTATLGNPALTSIEVLVVAGGGAGGGQGGNDGSGGGGAGGVIYNSNFSVTPGNNYTVTVGAGGAGVTAATRGNNGTNSIFDTLQAIGGGGGGAETGADRHGLSGGSGGGAGGYANTHYGGSGVPGQGNSGGNNAYGSGANFGGGGGGGASQAGAPGKDIAFNSTYTGNGGNGLQFSISGTPTWYAGGGGCGGGYSSTGGIGGLGGGGTGGNSVVGQAVAQSGVTNTGGGGGGAGGSIVGGVATSGSGGSGIVIVRYPGKIQKATGGTVTVVNNNTIHTFTSGTSTFTPYNYASPRYSTLSSGCITLNGVDQLVDLGISAYDLGIRRSATFSGWMMSNSGAAYLLSDWSDNLGMTLRFNDLTSADFYVYASNRRITVSYAFTVNVWYNIVGVMDGANMYMYINGVLVGTQTLGEDIGASPRTLKIGGRGDYSPPSLPQRVGSLQIYNRALSAAEILSNFMAMRGRYGI